MLYSLCDAPPEVDEIGEAGLALRALAAREFPVAPTWVLAVAAFDAALERAGVAADVAEIAWNIKGLWNDFGAARRVLDGIEPQRQRAMRALRQASLPDTLGKAVERLALAETLWTIRPSVVAEEGSEAFAGLFAPILSVPGGARLWDGVRQVWASAFRRETLLRCAEVAAGLPRLAVLFQATALITAQDRSGVATSHSPVAALSGPVVRAVYGAWQGDSVGSLYAAACGQWVVVSAHSTIPAKALVSSASGGLERQPYPQGQPPSCHSRESGNIGGQPLTSDEAQRLAGLVGEIAEQAGDPVQIEFVWPAGGEPLIVEARS